MRLFLLNFAGLAAMVFLQTHGKAGDDVLKDKIVRATLNHNEPTSVKVGTNGVTSLEFPYRIEAIDGYGFSQAPGPGDAFQISYAKGTNYFSVRALKPGVSGNLTVVLDQKVYSFFFQESSSPSFVNIYGLATDGELAVTDQREVAEKKKVATSNQLAGLLDKAKGYAALKSDSPQTLSGLQVTEPGKMISLGNEVESTIRRVLKDDSLNSVAFEVEINNRSAKDFLYDPQGVQVKVKDQVYEAAVEDAAGIVKAQSSSTVFLVVSQSGSEQQDNLASDNDFEVVIKGGTESSSAGMAFSQPPGDYLPTATTVGQAVRDPESRVAQEPGLDPPLPTPSPSPVKHAVPKKSVKKSDPKSESNAKDSVAKTQKPVAKKLFGWL
jgi:hypothetical protein